MTKLEQALELRDLIYSNNPGGCCLHIALDDGNLSDEDIKLCVQYAKEQKHPACVALAKLMLHMDDADRLDLFETEHRY